MRPSRVAALLALFSFLGCSDSNGPGGIDDPNTARVTDPAGDTFGTGAHQWDITAFSVSRDTGGIIVVLDFARPLIAPTGGDTGAMMALVDFDVDQDSTTGRIAQADHFRPGSGSTGLGSDYTLELTLYNPDSMVKVVDSSSVVQGLVKPVFLGNRVTIRVPRGLIGDDDGYLNAAAIAGRLTEPEDIVPENRALSLTP